MADTDKKDEDEQPVAEPEAKPNGGDDSKDDTKEEEKADKKGDMPVFERKPKPHPGEHFKDQFPDKIDKRGEPQFIEFKWDKSVKDMKDCDTIHMLYLLQIACELHRRRTIERNKYFESISRADRYISHVDTPQIITNFINWHNEDKEKNVFTGDMIKGPKPQKKLFMINEMISKVGTYSICILHRNWRGEFIYFLMIIFPVKIS